MSAVYLLGLETYNNPKRNSTNEDLFKAMCAISSQPKDRLQKLVYSTTVEVGATAYPYNAENVRNNMSEKLEPRYAKAAEAALDMASETVGAVFRSSGLEPTEITHIVTCTCTALFNPGLETMIPDMFGMRKDILAININFQGCHAGVKTLATAACIAKANPGARVMYICCEICSMFMPAEYETPMDIISSALFRDGCAAGIVGTDPLPKDKPLFEVLGRHSLRVPNTLDQMSWLMINERARLWLAKEIPDSIREGLPELLKPVPDMMECRLAIHPGGPAILEAVQTALDVPERDMKHSFGVLKRRGNLSSSCIFYVLQSHMKEIMEEKAKDAKSVDANRDVMLMAFGPGLTTECCRLKPVMA